MTARNLTAKIFLTAGAACLLVTAGLWGQARLAHGQLQLDLAAELEQVPARPPSNSPQLPNPEPISNASQPAETVPPLTTPEPLDVEPNQGQPIYRLLIPRIKVNNIVVYGSSDEALKKAPGHIEGTPFPWQGGNSAVAAHRDYFFWRMGELEIGDEVRVESAVDNRVYKVTEKHVVHESNVGVLSPTGKDQITLITCWPLIFMGDTPDRLVITAELQ